MADVRKLAAILVIDIVGFSRLTARDEDRTLARVRALRGDLVDPNIAAHRGRVVKDTGDGVLAEFRSAVDAVRSALELQAEMKEQNLYLPTGSRIDLRIGIHVGDVVEEADGDLMGDGVNIAARLEALAEPGGLCLSSAVYEHVRDKLTIDAVDLGLKELKNILRSMRIYTIPPAREIGILSDRIVTQVRKCLAFSDRPSIAVLPFHEMSPENEQGYFTDGVVEDIITGLSRIRWKFVIARNSSFTYKGRAVDVRQVGRELGVRYVLEGSVRKAGHRLRVTAQLVEAESGAYLWADKYDGALEDVFDFQDAITERVVGIVEPNVRKSEIERARRKRPDNLGAYDRFLRAMPYL
jgi:TolB-like protein/class 3 adenylate cyclase